MVLDPARGNLSSSEGRALVCHGDKSRAIAVKSVYFLTAKIFLHSVVIDCQIFLPLKRLSVSREKLMMRCQHTLFHLAKHYACHKHRLRAIITILKEGFCPFSSLFNKLRVER